MKSILAFALVAMLVVAVVAHGDHDHDHDHDHDDHDHGSAGGKSDVVVLTEGTFDDAVTKADISLVEFFAPWCGHCKQLAPQFDVAAKDLKPDGIVLASVDCTVEKELCNKYDVKGFPTLKIFRKGTEKPAEYQGGRKSADIIKFMRKQSEPAYIVLDNEAKLNEWAYKEGTNIVGFVSSVDSNEGKDFIASANSLRNEYSFGISTDAAQASKYGSAVPGAVLFKKEDDKTVHVAFSETGFSQANLEKFIKAEAFPLVGEIGPENFQQYLDRGLPLIWVFVDYAAEATKTILTHVNDAAKAYKGQLSVVKLDGVRWGEHAKHFGLSGKLPGIVAEDRENNKNYVYDESKEVTAEALKEHFKGFLAGSLTATQKSQEIPETNDGPVFTLVGKNFEQVVMDETKDVLVEFYAPWCGHCKSLAPKYEKLGQSFKDSPSVVIAQIDATENDSSFNVQGFPTIVFWPGNNKKNPITYDGDRTVAAMEKFVRENASTLGGSSAGGDATKSSHDEL